MDMFEKASHCTQELPLTAFFAGTDASVETNDLAEALFHGGVG